MIDEREESRGKRQRKVKPTSDLRTWGNHWGPLASGLVQWHAGTALNEDSEVSTVDPGELSSESDIPDSASESGEEFSFTFNGVFL